MQAIVEVSGKQYIVESGQTIKVATQVGEPGAKLTFDKVLLVTDGDKANIDKINHKVSATLIAHGLGEKIRVFKHHAKKRYRRTAGHRQAYTEIKIDAIEATK